MRTSMTKQVEFTVIRLASMHLNHEGQPEVIALPDEITLGTLSLPKAKKHASKLYPDIQVTVLNVEHETKVYEMLVEEFIKVAKVKDDKPNEVHNEG